MARSNVERLQPLSQPSVSSAAEPAIEETAADGWSDDEELQTLLEKAKQAARVRKAAASTVEDGFATQADTIAFDDDEEDAEPARKRRKADPLARPVTQRDLRRDEPIASTSKAEPTMSKWGELPTKRLSKKAMLKSKAHTAGPKWFDMPSQQATPQLRREVQAMRLHGVLDPKRFLRGEAKRERQALPEFFQIGHILPTRHPASTGAQLGSSKRKRTFVEELVEDAQARTRARKAFSEVQAKAASGGKQWFARMKAQRGSGKAKR